MKRRLIGIGLCAGGCASLTNTPKPATGTAQLALMPATQPSKQTPISEKEWLGIYASTSEIARFSGTVLALETPLGHDDSNRLWYRIHTYSDSRAKMIGEIRDDEPSGEVFIDGPVLYIPEASGYVNDGKTQLSASIERYTRIQINHYNVLMRDDALRAYRRDNRLYDYGVLVQVRTDSDPFVDLSKVVHTSIKVLYADPSKPWGDPFVHGANDR